ncbi:hypothetical protein D3C84_423750 [compost metagenome]
MAAFVAVDFRVAGIADAGGVAVGVARQGHAPQSVVLEGSKGSGLAVAGQGHGAFPPVHAVSGAGRYRCAATCLGLADQLAQLVVAARAAVGGAPEGFGGARGIEGVADVIAGEGALGQLDGGDAVHGVVAVAGHPAEGLGDRRQGARGVDGATDDAAVGLDGLEGNASDMAHMAGDAAVCVDHAGQIPGRGIAEAAGHAVAHLLGQAAGAGVAVADGAGYV